eukprot:CAMPEP_0170745024 /NCGR_PEP_ID=MMETSP0437-20130122/8084_1 /TAXON_ID=0 /ORGANISM="Sexangularia sp." /LENGTH=92 /DNA_ID=CAMNT_0011083739 /DNA_START=135 /DNA_END=410 /DNA_ORIENTATION=+
MYPRLTRSFATKFGSTRKHRGSLHSKETPPGWFKGSGGRRLGRHSRKGRFTVDPLAVPLYPAPTLSLADPPLKPYVARAADRNVPLGKAEVD